MSVAAAVAQQIQQVGAGFMFSREAKSFGAATGAEGFIGPYTRGRGGVLGDVDADVVASAFGFFRPDTVRSAWESVSLSPAVAADQYASACHGFARRKLSGFDEAGRLAELLGAVAEAADVAGVPLFAGWRALPLPDDAVARAMQLTHVLRELRGGLHLLAVRAQGLEPRQAVLIAGSPRGSGVDQARLFGWPEPFEDITDAMRQRWAAAEALTDELVAPAFAVLDERSGQDLVRLVDRAQSIVFGG